MTIKTSRLAFDDSILETIMVSEVIGEEQSLPLSELAVLDVAIIDGIYASKETKRDMGLIRGSRFQLRKRAPLGIP